jgi:RNA-directed DNA polymerase
VRGDRSSAYPGRSAVLRKLFPLPMQRCMGMGWQKSAEAIVPGDREGLNTKAQGIYGGFGSVAKQQTSQLAFDYEEAGEARPGSSEEHQAAPAPSAQRTLAQSLMEAVVDPKNMREALKRVRRNKGSAGIDGMTVDELPGYLLEHWQSIRAALLEGSYSPQPVRRVEIPKPDGGVRQLGIPTVVDRLIQQAVLQVLDPLYDPTFSNSSYGFRPGRSAHQAVKSARDHVAGGRRWVVDLDLEKFFDRVNHDILMGRLARRIGDKRMLRLIRAYLGAGVMANGVVMERREGTPQGGPLSPLLANILLDEFDKELERRGHAFCRYADDCNIYVATRRAGERVMESLVRFLEGKLRLKVNRAKSGVARPIERKFLGLRIIGVAKAHIAIAPKSLERFKKTVRRITKRNRGISLSQMLVELNRYTMGWVNYFGIAQLKSIAQGLDSWIRRRLRCFIWKQWKRYGTRVRNLRNAGVGPWLAYGMASGKHGPWNVAGSPAMTRSIPNEYLSKQGYKSLYDRYTALAS